MRIHTRSSDKRRPAVKIMPLPSCVECQSMIGISPKPASERDTTRRPGHRRLRPSCCCAGKRCGYWSIWLSFGCSQLQVEDVGERYELQYPRDRQIAHRRLGNAGLVCRRPHVCEHQTVALEGGIGALCRPSPSVSRLLSGSPGIFMHAAVDVVVPAVIAAANAALLHDSEFERGAAMTRNCDAARRRDLPRSRNATRFLVQDA